MQPAGLEKSISTYTRHKFLFIGRNIRCGECLCQGLGPPTHASKPPNYSHIYPQKVHNIKMCMSYFVICFSWLMSPWSTLPRLFSSLYTQDYFLRNASRLDVFFVDVPRRLILIIIWEHFCICKIFSSSTSSTSFWFSLDSVWLWANHLLTLTGIIISLDLHTLCFTSNFAKLIYYFLMLVQNPIWSQTTVTINLLDMQTILKLWPAHSYWPSLSLSSTQSPLFHAGFSKVP